MKKELIIKSEFDCVIYSQNEIIGTIEVNKLNNELHLIVTEETILNIYPINKDDGISYNLIILDNEALQKINKYCKITKIEEEKYLIYLNKCEINKSTEFKTILTGNDIEIFIYENNKTSFFIKNKNYYNNYSSSLLLDNFKLEELKDYYIIHSNVYNKLNFILINKKLEICLEKLITKYEINNNKLELLTLFNDVYQTGKVEIYDLNNLNLIDEYFVYENTNNTKFNENLISYVFMENIKNKNFKIARTLLSDFLSSKISDDELASYFGNINFIDVYPENYKKIICFNDNESKIFSFTIENNKITNIDC